jgi:hypothetical protein
MSTGPGFLIVFVLGVLFASTPLWGQISDDNNFRESSPCNEQKEGDDAKACDDNKKDDDSKKDDAKNKCDDSKKEDDTKKDAEKKKEEPPKIGNFALPTSQQPAALFGFGGNIIDKGEIQWYFFADDFNGPKQNTVDLIPGILFGITEDWSIFFNLPVTPLMKDGHNQSRGFEDCFIQLEYAFYNNSTSEFVDEATIVGNVTFPSGSTKRNPPTGFGAPSLFLGGTYYRTYVDWILFTAQGAVLTTSEHGTKIGDQFLYQWGIGKNIPSPEGWIYAWLLEVDGQYNKRNRIHGDIDPNSGGNTIYVTPSIWVSTKEMIFQFGVSLPVNQNLFGEQRKFDYALNLNFSWSFY